MSVVRKLFRDSSLDIYDYEIHVKNSENTMHRRSFIASVSAVGVLFTGVARAIDPFVRKTPGRMRLSLAAYSMRKYLTETNDPADKIDLIQFVEYCHELGLSGAELTSYYFPKDVNNAYIADLKRLCHLRGLSISGGAIANDFCQSDKDKIAADIEHTKLWIDRYSLLGAPVIRIFAGSQPSNEAWDTVRKRCIAAIEEVAQYAESRGVMLALENHGGVTATAKGLLEIVRGVNSPAFGVNFDSGNFRDSSDPYAELAEIAPFAVNAQIKVDMYPAGKQEPADLARVLEILGQAGYHGWVALEYEAEEDPRTAIPRYVAEIQKLLGG
jgi:sugar phosphate isomerase/epimerase